MPKFVDCVQEVVKDKCGETPIRVSSRERERERARVKERESRERERETETKKYFRSSAPSPLLTCALSVPL